MKKYIFVIRRIQDAQYTYRVYNIHRKSAPSQEKSYSIAEKSVGSGREKSPGELEKLGADPEK